MSCFLAIRLRTGTRRATVAPAHNSGRLRRPMPTSPKAKRNAAGQDIRVITVELGSCIATAHKYGMYASGRAGNVHIGTTRLGPGRR